MRRTTLGQLSSSDLNSSALDTSALSLDGQLHFLLALQFCGLLQRRNARRLALRGPDVAPVRPGRGVPNETIVRPKRSRRNALKP